MIIKLKEHELLFGLYKTSHLASKTHIATQQIFFKYTGVIASWSVFICDKLYQVDVSDIFIHVLHFPSNTVIEHKGLIIIVNCEPKHHMWHVIWHEKTLPKYSCVTLKLAQQNHTIGLFALT